MKSKQRLMNKYFFRLATKLRITPFWPFADHLPGGNFSAVVLWAEVLKLFSIILRFKSENSIKGCLENESNIHPYC